MSRGDAFNRSEVSSVYVRPKSRYVVSLVVGLEEGEAAGPNDAALQALEMVRGPDRGGVVWMIFDRVTGELHEVTQALLDPEAMPPSSRVPAFAVVEPDPFPSSRPPPPDKKKG